MADNKATALTEANYNIKLILGVDPNHRSKIIDITKPIVDALSYRDIFPEGVDDIGIAHRIIGVLEQTTGPGAPNYLHSPALRTNRQFISLVQDINRILDATIVNNKQLEAVKELVADVFKKYDDDCMAGINRVLAEHIDSQTQDILNSL